MRAVVCSQLGPAQDLTVGEMPDPTHGAGQVRIEVRAAGVNYVIARFVEGRFQIKPPLPFVELTEYWLADVGAALADLQGRSLVGKAVLVP